MSARLWIVVGLASLALGSITSGCGGSGSTGFGGSGGGTTSGDPTTTSGPTTGVGGGTSSSTATSTASATASATTSSATTGATTSSTGTGGGPACPGLGDVCSNCGAMQCSDLYCTCSKDAACTSLVACVAQCAPGDTNCTQKCYTQNQNGISEAGLLSDCAANKCMAQCPAAVKATPCELCLFQNCAMPFNKCLANPECEALVLCASACNGDFGCQLNCAQQYSGGVNDAMGVQNCTQGVCANAQCG
jgi:hypothetical protein